MERHVTDRVHKEFAHKLEMRYQMYEYNHEEGTQINKDHDDNDSCPETIKVKVIYVQINLKNVVYDQTHHSESISR